MQDRHIPFATLQRRTADELATAQQLAKRYAPKLDLGELILSRMQHPPRRMDERKLEAWSEVSESMRQRSGQAPLGTWVPLHALSRDLTTSNSAALTSGKIDPNNAASLLPSSAVLGAGATVLTGLQGSTYAITVTDPAASADGAWTAEGNPSPQREPGFKQAVLTPHTLTVQTTVSRRLIQQASVDVNALLSAELSKRLSYTIDKAALLGSGTGQPLGILNNVDLDVQAAGGNGAAPTYAHLVELEHQVMTRASGNTLAPSYVTSPKLAKKLRLTQRVSGQDGFIYEGRDLLGHGVRVAPNMPDNLDKGTSTGVCSALLFGDMAEIVVGFWGPAAVDLLIDDVTMAKDGLVRIVARAEVGIVPRRIGAFSAYKDLLAA